MKTIEKEPLFHVIKRSDVSIGKSFLFRAIAIILGLIFACLVLLVITGANPFVVIQQLFAGCFGTPRRFWTMFRKLSLLLLVGLALIPAFKMKFWNLGGNGQILMGALTTACCMHFLGNEGFPNWAIILIMIPSSILVSVIWAVIPAIFKAFFNTNESLFTLMLNYVAEGIVAVFLSGIFKSPTGSIGIISTGHLPAIGSSSFVGRNDLLSIIVAFVLLGIVFAYLRYAKHGYELEVVGESQNTARYIGINVKGVVIRTMVLSGVICGIVGILLAGSINHSISTATPENMGFTAIMVAWLAKFNPLSMVATAFIITFFSRGMAQVQKYYEITNDSATYIFLGIIYFFIIGVEFFISYRVVFKDCKFIRWCNKVNKSISKAFAPVGVFFTNLKNKIIKVFVKEGK
ncbi:MAG: hypothetical protein PUA56_02705 [Bacillales bacterium]|nr:hypothetical protein [Bacillales bacterium]